MGDRDDLVRQCLDGPVKVTAVHLAGTTFKLSPGVLLLEGERVEVDWVPGSAYTCIADLYKVDDGIELRNARDISTIPWSLQEG